MIKKRARKMNGAEEEDKIHDDGGNLHSGDTLTHTQRMEHSSGLFMKPTFYSLHFTAIIYVFICV